MQTYARRTSLVLSFALLLSLVPATTAESMALSAAPTDAASPVMDTVQEIHGDVVASLLSADEGPAQGPSAAEESATDEEETRPDIVHLDAPVDLHGALPRDLLPELDLVGDRTEDPAPTDAPAPAPASTSATDVHLVGDGTGSGLIAAGAFTAVAIGIGLASKGAWLRLLAASGAGLFSRFQGSDLLDHPRRAELHALVCREPGITVPDLASATGLSRNTVLHHLRMLESQRMIVSQALGRKVHWYENGGRYGRDHKAAYAVLQDDRSSDVARYVRTHPGTTQGHLAQALGLAPSVVTWHLKRLESAALVDRRRDGRRMLCYPADVLSSLNL